MTNATTVRTNFYGLQMMNHSGNEFFALAADTATDSAAVYNRIAGWSFDSSSLTSSNINGGTDGAFSTAGIRLNSAG
jgi:hypothetical protein